MEQSAAVNKISPLLSCWKPGQGLLKTSVAGRAGSDMTRSTAMLVNRLTAAAIGAAALLLCSAAHAQSTGDGPLSFLERIFKGGVSQEIQPTRATPLPSPLAQMRPAPTAAAFGAMP